MNVRGIGIALVILGLAGLAYGGFGFKKKEEVARLGDLKMEVTREERVNIPPLVSGIVLLAGAALLFGAGKKAG
jgi:hypothetical protein